MKKLEIEFEGKGEVSDTRFRQLEKSGKAFIYELTDIETGQIRYEVFEKREQKASESIFVGIVIKFEEKELYPKSNDFGVWAWCTKNLETAIGIFEEINNKPNEL